MSVSFPCGSYVYFSMDILNFTMMMMMMMTNVQINLNSMSSSIRNVEIASERVRYGCGVVFVVCRRGGATVT